jgi:hypothetical protein
MLPATETEHPHVPANPTLYSDRAIRGFSIIFSAVAGGVLLAQNFRDIGRPDAARKALWGSIGSMALVLLIMSFLPDEMSSIPGLGIGIGFAGSYVLLAYADKIMGDRSAYPAKKIGKPLLICLLIFTPLIALMVYAAVNE